MFEITSKIIVFSSANTLWFNHFAQIQEARNWITTGAKTMVLGVSCTRIVVIVFLTHKNYAFLLIYVGQCSRSFEKK